MKDTLVWKGKRLQRWYRQDYIQSPLIRTLHEKGIESVHINGVSIKWAMLFLKVKNTPFICTKKLNTYIKQDISIIKLNIIL